MNYKQQLQQKIKKLESLLKPFSPPKMEIFPSQSKHYRMRAEFRIWHDDKKISYAMMGENGEIIKIEQFPPACSAINTIMPHLLTTIENQPILRQKLFRVDFHATLRGEMMITLVYHKPLTEQWRKAAETLAQMLACQIIGRARKQKEIIGRDFVREMLSVTGKNYHYRQYEGSFSQPNAYICEKMIHWTQTQCAGNRGDLLELYCGNGNFTLPLSALFRQVLATEISKSGIQALKENIEENHINNIKVARLSAEEFSAALVGERVFRRMIQAGIELSNYNFSTILVDPPRAGVDQKTLQLMQQFPFIVYISCNPETLAENLTTLTQTHSLSSVALFDQFPQTPHIESGVFLKKREQ